MGTFEAGTVPGGGQASSTEGLPTEWYSNPTARRFAGERMFLPSKMMRLRMTPASFCRSAFAYSLHSVAMTRTSASRAHSYMSSTSLTPIGFRMGAAVCMALGSVAVTMAPSPQSFSHSFRAMDSRTSSVFCLKARPQTAIFLSLRTHRRSRILSRKWICWVSLMCSTSSNRVKGMPSVRLMLMKALTSFGKQDPP